jgi:hypothetical protein
MAKVVEHKELANHAAVRLAPYLHPKLASVEVKAEQSAPFVIGVPKVEADSERWARAAEQAKLINSPNTDGSGK